MYSRPRSAPVGQGNNNSRLSDVNAHFFSWTLLPCRPKKKTKFKAIFAWCINPAPKTKTSTIHRSVPPQQLNKPFYIGWCESETLKTARTEHDDASAFLPIPIGDFLYVGPKNIGVARNPRTPIVIKAEKKVF